MQPPAPLLSQYLSWQRVCRMVSQRQLAERQRVEGNALYSQKQYTAAFQCYDTGLEAERHNMALHSNAAQVLIKMGCYVQAIEHCDKVYSSPNDQPAYIATNNTDKQWQMQQRCHAGFAPGRVSAQQANRPIVCQGFLAQSSCKKGLPNDHTLNLGLPSQPHSHNSLPTTRLITGVEALCRSNQGLAASS